MLIKTLIDFPQGFFFFLKVEKLMKNLVFRFKIIDIKRKTFMNFSLKMICDF